MKKCSKCGTPKPVEMFARLARSPDGRNPRCLACATKYQREYYAANPDKSRAWSRSNYAKNSSRILANARKRRAENPAVRLREQAARKKSQGRRKKARRIYELKKKYGLSIDAYTALLVKQGGVCAICRKPPGLKEFCVDHDHVTGKVRGLLHEKCNFLLGNAEDSVERLEAAAEYLRVRQLSPAPVVQAEVPPSVH